MKTEPKNNKNSPLQAPHDYLPSGAKGHWLTLTCGPDSGKSMFYFELNLGNQEPQQTLLFVHGNPESSYTFHRTINALQQQWCPKRHHSLRIIAMDHIGFGLSDQASYEMVDMHHAANLEQLISHLNLDRITLIIHDWGGPIGVGSLINQPDRVANIVLMNTTVFPIPLDGLSYARFPIPWLLPWSRIGHWCPNRYWGHMAALVMGSSVGIPAFLGHCLNYVVRAATNRLTLQERVYREMFASNSNAQSSRRNVKQTPQWGHGYRYYDQQLGWQDNHQFYATIQEKISQVWGNRIGVRALFGLWDPCGQESVQQQWLEALPQLQGHIQRFADAGHFVEEVKFDEIAAAVLSLQNRSPKTRVDQPD